MNIKSNLTELIGKTPLLELTAYNKTHNIPARIVAKLESFNPLGSVKDRTAFAMIAEGERLEKIREGTVIVEPTSGNTGIGLAFVCAAKGYELILTMPDSMSAERGMLLHALGAKLIKTDGARGMAGAIARAQEICDELPNAFMPMQFENPANPKIHEVTTGKEILMDTDGRIDIFVAGFGTGGTISGVAKTLRQANPAVKIIGVEPAGSPVVTEGHAGKHSLQGIGAGFIPKALDLSIIDEVVTVTDEAAYETVRALCKTEGLLAGISSGAAVYAAQQIAMRPENAEKLIVVLLPDSGERYISTGIFD